MVRLAAFRAGSTLAPMESRDTTTNQIMNPVGVYVMEVEALNRARLIEFDIRLLMGKANSEPIAQLIIPIR